MNKSMSTSNEQINCESFDSKFSNFFDKSTSSSSQNKLQEALQETSRFVLSSFDQDAPSFNNREELFSSRRSADWKQQENETNSQTEAMLKPVRVVGFVQELDTEASLIEVDPKHFVKSVIVGEEEAQVSSDGQTQQQPLFAECLSAFITPIPGFRYTEAEEEADQDQEQQNSFSSAENVEEEHSASESTDGGKIQKRDRLENAASSSKRARAEEEEGGKDNDGGEQKSKSKKKNKVTAIAYGDEDHIRKNTNVADRKMWKDVLGLSLAPTHESLATGVVGLFPSAGSHVDSSASSASSPQLFELVELFGFLVPPPPQQQQEQGQEDSTQQQHVGRGDVAEDPLEGEMVSKFHRIPDSVAPRLLVVSWRQIPSVEKAHEMLSKKKEANNSNNDNEESAFSALKTKLKETVFGNEVAERNADAAAFCLLLHLVSSVTIRNESGAFGDLALAYDAVFSRENSSVGAEQEQTFHNFVSRLSKAARVLRPCSMSCEVQYKVATETTTANSNNAIVSKNQQHQLNLIHSSSLIARLDYEQQAVSSCLFSLPRGAEMIFAVDDVTNETNMDAVINVSTNIKRNTHVQQQQKSMMQSFSNYSRNVAAFSELMISQKLPLLFGPGCEISFERDLGFLFVVRKRIEEEEESDAKKEKQQASPQVQVDGDAATKADENLDNKAAAFGRDIFVPLRCKIELGSSEKNSNNIVETTTPFESYFSRVRELYRSCGPSAENQQASYFEETDGDDYFLKIINQTLKNNSAVWWSTAMIKHSAANVLLTMARARACLGGRKLVRKADLDEVTNLLVHIKTNRA